MMMTSLKQPCSPIPNILNDDFIQDELCLDDDFTVKLQVKELPLDIQLMLVPMWTLRSDYHDCMEPLDRAMESYMTSREGLMKIDKNLDLGIATNHEIATAFDHVMSLMNFYEKNQTELLRLLQKGNHQLSFYSRATKDNLMWDEMMKLKDIDYVSYTQRTCCFEHVAMSLFKLVESIRDSLQTSQDISRCCATYLIRISKYFNFPENHRPLTPPEDFEELDGEILPPIRWIRDAEVTLTEELPLE